MEFIDLHAQYLHLKKEIDAEIKEVIASTHFISGPKVKELEAALAKYVGVKHCVTCANGTDALTLAMRALNVKKGDAVFVPDFTYFATAEVVSLEGATPIFVDVNETFNMDAGSLKKAIDAVKKEGKLNLKAIIVVDLFGQPADYEHIRPLADENNMLIVEDGAQGFGGDINGKKACSFGDISCTSFFPVKPLGCYGDGGAVFTDNDDYYNLIASLAVHGKGSDKYDNIRIGYNSRLDTLQAAILMPKLKALDDFELASRDRIYKRYSKALEGHYVVPTILKNHFSSWAQYTILCKSEEHRAKVQESLKAAGIPTMIYYKVPMHCEKVYKDIKQYVTFENSERYMKCAVSLPMYPYLDESTQDVIIKELLKVE